MCRTTARSTQHENAFILDRRYCFSKASRALGGQALRAAGDRRAVCTGSSCAFSPALHSMHGLLLQTSLTGLSLWIACSFRANPLQLGRPHVPVPPAPPLPKSIKLVAGAAAQPCDAACAAKGMACKAEHFAGLNDCNSLRAKFMCEAGGAGAATAQLCRQRKGARQARGRSMPSGALRRDARPTARAAPSLPAGCGAAAADQREFPGYIEGSAPKHQRPAFCAVLPPFPGQPGPAFNCSQAAGSVRRLCPCEPLPAAAVAATQDAGAIEGADGQQAAAGVGDAAQQAAAAAQQAQQAQQQQAAAQQQQAAGTEAQQGALQLGQQQQQQPQQLPQPTGTQ